MRGIYVYIKHNIDYFQINVISLWRVLEIATRVVPGVNGKCLDMCDLHEAVEKKRNLPPLFIYYFTIKQHYDMENYCISSIAFIVLFIVQGFGWYNMHDTVSWIPDAQRYDTGNITIAPAKQTKKRSQEVSTSVCTVRSAICRCSAMTRAGIAASNNRLNPSARK